MSPAQCQDYESLLDKANELAREYRWIEAVLSCRRALDLVLRRNDFSEAANIQERIGFCLSRAARQSKSVKEFRGRTKAAAKAYEAAATLFQEIISGKSFFCKAMATYLRSWLAPAPFHKKRMLKRCAALMKNALTTFEKTRNLIDYGRACNKLVLFFLESMELEVSWRKTRSIFEEAMIYSEKAISYLSEVESKDEIAEIYSLASLFCCYDVNEQEKTWIQKSRHFAEKALSLSHEIADAILAGELYQHAAWAVTVYEDNPSLAQRLARKALRTGICARDNLLIGYSYSLLAVILLWRMQVEESPIRKRLGYDRITKYALRGLSYCRRFPKSPEFILPFFGCMESYLCLSSEVETDLLKKHRLLEKALDIGKEGLCYARRSGMPRPTSFVLHSLSKVLYSLAKMETEISKRKKLLEKAMFYREEQLNIVGKRFHYTYWNVGSINHHQALTMAELADIEESKERKIDLLESAALKMEKCLELCGESSNLFPQTGLFAVLGRYNDLFGKILCQLHILQGKDELLNKAVVIYGNAIEAFAKCNMSASVAEAHWQIGKTRDQLGQYEESARSFETASEMYKTVASQISQLEEFYMELSLYMLAWSAIEKAKYNHAVGKYAQSAKHYEKVAELHNSTKSWSYLAPNYLAWAKLEQAEDLSRKAKSQAAMAKFKDAFDLFISAKESIEPATAEAEKKDEREQAIRLRKACDFRSEYCRGRIWLEEAMICGRKGDYRTSAEKFGLSSGVFRKMAERYDSEMERQEIYQLMYTCGAWQAMMTAEWRFSAESYKEAAELFEKAKEHSTEGKSRLLAAGNSAFCKALEVGIRFEATRDVEQYRNVKELLESSAGYYVRAGFESESAWVTATEALFDAYMYLGEAEARTEFAEKMHFYELAEKHLERAASLFEKGRYEGRKREVSEILKKVSEKRAFTFTVSKVLQTSTNMTSTDLILAPTPTYEAAVGAQSFEDANVKAHLKIPTDADVGEQFEIALDLVNVGKDFGLLVRVDDIVPAEFKIVSFDPCYTLEGNALNVGGKKIVPLKAETIKISAQATRAGCFELHPQIVYVDTSGQFKQSVPPAATLTVRHTLAFEFKTEQAGSVFKYLINAFIEDYIKRRLLAEKCGWRSLTQCLRSTRVPKASVYGTSKNPGYVVSELTRRSVAETRIFPGERGRGGRVLKIRISYDREFVKHYIDKRIMGPPEN